MAEPTPRWAPWLTLPLAVAGLGLSTYLTYVHYVEPDALSCPDIGIVNCTKVTTSPESMLFGAIPVALAGAVYFLVMCALVAPPAWRELPSLRALRVAGAVAGVGMVCYLVYVEALVVKALCLYCTAVHAITVVLFVVVLAATVLPPPPGGRAPRRAAAAE